MKIVRINDKPYAVGLWWQLAKSKKTSRKTILQAARTSAKEFQEKSYASVAITKEQFGLAEGMCTTRPLALAASIKLKMQISQGFIGVFRFTEGWWVCGISATIAAEGDVFFSTEEEAKVHARFLGDLFSSKEEVFCATQEESEAFLAPLLFHGSIVEPLYPGIAAYTRYLHRIGIALGVLVFIFGVKLAWDTWADESAKEKAERLMQSKEAREQRITANIDRYFPALWKQSPSVMAVQSQCMDVLFALPLFEHGWKQESVLCTPNKLTVHWKYQSGATFTKLPHHATITTANNAVSHINLPVLPKRSSQKKLLSAKEITSLFYEVTRQLHCHLKSLAFAKPETKTIEGIRISASFQKGTWQLDAIPSALVRNVAFDFLSQVPGLTITSIEYNNAQWTLKGDVYAHARY